MPRENLGRVYTHGVGNVHQPYSTYGSLVNTGEPFPRWHSEIQTYLDTLNNPDVVHDNMNAGYLEGFRADELDPSDVCCATQAAHGLYAGEHVYYDESDFKWKKGDASDDTKIPSGFIETMDGESFCVRKSGITTIPDLLVDDDGEPITDGYYIASDNMPGKLRNPDGPQGYPAIIIPVIHVTRDCVRVCDMGTAFTIGGAGGGFDCTDMAACAAFTALEARVDNLECPPRSNFDETDFPITLDDSYCNEVVTIEITSQTLGKDWEVRLPPFPSGLDCCCITIKHLDSSATEGKASEFAVIGDTGSGTSTFPEKAIDGKFGGVNMFSNQATKFCYDANLGFWVRE